MIFARLRRRRRLADARAAFARGDLASASDLLGHALAVDEADPIAHNLLAMVLRDKGDARAAESHLRRALELDPALADAHINLGAVLNEQGRAVEAEASFRRAVAQEPGNAIGWCNLGLVLAEQGNAVEADRCFQSALAADPQYFYARLTRVMNKLREVYDSDDDLQRSRAEYEKALKELSAWVPKDERELATAAGAVGWITPFFLAYQGMNDRELQRIYGSFACGLMARRYPDLAHSLPARARTSGEPVRVGIASGFFCDHSVWKMLTRGWLQNLDRSKFAIHGYYTGHRQDAETAVARSACTHFVEGLAFEPLAKKIRGDALDVLIYPDIGMDPATSKLAALRLAPVQCTSWGHPTTSGMPTIDYFLTSEVMEPADGDQHYTERLIRLPNLSVHYTPRSYPLPALDRAALGLRPAAVAYFCAQSLFKYSPRHDSLFPRIARKLDDSQFIFVASQRAPTLTQRFYARIARAFESEGMDPARHVVMLPRMDLATFQAVARQCDVFLDSIDWSGCNSALECMVTGLVPVTCAGSTMRARHTYAFLELMQLGELIAPDFARYAELAASLGRDAARRDELRSRMIARLPALFGDLTCVRALEDFLRSASASEHRPVPSAHA